MRAKVRNQYKQGRTKAEAAVVISQMIDLFPYKTGRKSQIEKRIRAGVSRIYDEMKAFYINTENAVSNNLGFCFDIPHSWITNGTKYLDLPSKFQEMVFSPQGYIHISGGTQKEDTHFPLLTRFSHHIGFLCLCDSRISMNAFIFAVV